MTNKKRDVNHLNKVSIINVDKIKLRLRSFNKTNVMRNANKIA